MKEITVILVGASGYGDWYLDTLFSRAEEHGVRLIGVIDPCMERCRRLTELNARGIPLFSSLHQFYTSHRCDLSIISSPIHLHCDQVCLALAHGSHVLCEKPLCASSDDIERMLTAERRSGKTVTIGYQWSFSDAIQALKADVLAGRFGKAVRLRTLALTPRAEHYYQRSAWAGRQRTTSGDAILDSPVNNATAHYLHNMLYVLGARIAQSASPGQMEAELWRANSIENYDTALLRFQTKEGAELLFYTSHAVQGPARFAFSYEFERATIFYDSSHGTVSAEMADGKVIDYGSPTADPYLKLWHAAESARTGNEPLCGIVAAAPHVQCVLQVQESWRGIRDFSPDDIGIDRSGLSPLRFVKGFAEVMEQCYETGKLLSEQQPDAIQRPLLQ